jgi:hypothetical protein
VAVAEVARARGDAVLIEPIDGGAAVFGGPGEPFNKVAGLGFSGEPLDEGAVARIEREFDARHEALRLLALVRAELAPDDAQAALPRGGDA